jgi:hypothetical protein
VGKGLGYPSFIIPDVEWLHCAFFSFGIVCYISSCTCTGNVPLQWKKDLLMVSCQSVLGDVADERVCTDVV